MKTDMTVEQLVSKVNDLSLIKRDYCVDANKLVVHSDCCLLYTSPSPRDRG